MILRERVAHDNLIVCWRGFNAKLRWGWGWRGTLLWRYFSLSLSPLLLSNYAIFSIPLLCWYLLFTQSALSFSLLNTIEIKFFFLLPPLHPLPQSFHFCVHSTPRGHHVHSGWCFVVCFLFFIFPFVHFIGGVALSPCFLSSCCIKARWENKAHWHGNCSCYQHLSSRVN